MANPEEAFVPFGGLAGGLAGAVKLVGAPGNLVEALFVELVASPLAVAVLASAGLATCDDGLGGYWGFEVAAVLLLNGLDFQNARLLLPPDWQPAKPVSATTAHT